MSRGASIIEDEAYATVAEVRELPVFTDIADDDLVLLKHGLARERFAPGEQLFRQGEAAESAFLIAEGQAEILTRLPGGDQVVVATVGRGALVGETSLLCEGVRTASVKCVQPTTGFRMDRRFFKASIARRDVAAFCILRQVMAVMAVRLGNLNSQIVSLAALNSALPLKAHELARHSPQCESGPSFEFRDFLSSLAFLREFGPSDIAELLARGRVFTLPKAVRLFGQGDPTEELFIVLRGGVATCGVKQDHLYPVEIVGPGKVCGADDVIAGRRRAEIAYTISEATLLEVSAETFQALATERSWMSYCFQIAVCDAQLESLARANRRLSHAVTQAAMLDQEAMSRVPGGRFEQ